MRSRQVTVMIVPVLLLMTLVSTPSWGGANGGGALIVHTSGAIYYRASHDYCGAYYEDPGSCENARTQTDAYPDVDISVVWFIAAFRTGQAPAVTAVQFGIRHDLPASDYFVGFSPCVPMVLELPDSGWPFGDGHVCGNLVAYGQPVYSSLFPIYWFAVYGATPQSYIGTWVYPNTGEAKFVDDQQPPQEDLCENFGIVRWQAPGYNQCPGAPAPPACCFPDDRCTILPEGICTSLGGTPLGPGSECFPNPCLSPPLGACCFPDGHCELLTTEHCVQLGGDPQGDGTVCDPNPCPIVPIEGTTWGRVKSSYR